MYGFWFTSEAHTHSFCNLYSPLCSSCRSRSLTERSAMILCCVPPKALYHTHWVMASRKGTSRCSGSVWSKSSIDLTSRTKAEGRMPYYTHCSTLICKIINKQSKYRFYSLFKFLTFCCIPVHSIFLRAQSKHGRREKVCRKRRASGGYEGQTALVLAMARVCFLTTCISSHGLNARKSNKKALESLCLSKWTCISTSITNLNYNYYWQFQ